MGRPPERHVLAEEPVPEIVEWEAEEREGAGGGDQRPAERDLVVLSDLDRRATRMLAGLDQHRREIAAGDDPIEPDEDEEVRGIGEWACITAAVDVEGYVPHVAEQRADQGEAGDRQRQRRPGRQPRYACREGGEGAERSAPPTPVRLPEQDQRREA